MRASNTILFALFVTTLMTVAVFAEEAATQRRATVQETYTQNAANDKQKTATTAGTHTKPPPQEVELLFFKKGCLDKFLKGHLDIECIKFSISKGLSYGVIAGSLLYKAPQIIKILRSGSVEGLSLSSFYFQVIMAFITIGYNVHIHSPLTTYAETISVLVQTLLIIGLMWKFNPKTSRACVIASTATFAGIAAVLYLDILPNFLYEGIAIINIVLFFLAVSPQIMMNYQQKSTGQLAFLTVFLAFAGNLARVFTTIQEVKDPWVMLLFITGTVLNGIVILQFLIYRGKTPLHTKGNKTEAKKVK